MQTAISFDGRVVLVTGGGSGIGSSTARLFSRAGARVAVVDIQEDAAAAIVRQIQESGGEAIAIRADVSKDADNRAAIDRVLTTWGRVDIFHANAGVPHWPTAIEDLEEATVDQVLMVNVKGVLLGIKHVAPAMKRQKRGVILITGSAAGIRPRQGMHCYSASKAAVHLLGKALALELAPFGVRVVVLAPGGTETPMFPAFVGKVEVDEQAMTRYRGNVPLGRLVTPQDVAQAALFAASDAASMFTGSALVIDGGRCV